MLYYVFPHTVHINSISEDLNLEVLPKVPLVSEFSSSSDFLSIEIMLLNELDFLSYCSWLYYHMNRSYFKIC